MAEIIVTVETDGTSAVEVKGVKGKSCETLTAGIEASLGSVTERVRTKEYNEREQTTDNSNRLRR